MNPPPAGWSWGTAVRTLPPGSDIDAARASAREEYVATFTAWFDLTPPPREWLDRWWPATS